MAAGAVGDGQPLVPWPAADQAMGGNEVASVLSTGQIIMASARSSPSCYSAPHACELRRHGRLRTVPVCFGFYYPGVRCTPSIVEGVLVSTTLNPSSTRRRAVGASRPAGACLTEHAFLPLACHATSCYSAPHASELRRQRRSRPWHVLAKYRSVLLRYYNYNYNIPRTTLTYARVRTIIWMIPMLPTS